MKTWGGGGGGGVHAPGSYAYVHGLNCEICEGCACETKMTSEAIQFGP